MFAIDPSDATAPYEQLRRQIVEQAHTGTLPAGTRLPPVRSLAQELGLAANTVARAYRELERDDAIVTRGRAGSFIAESGDAVHRQAQAAATTYAERIRHLGLDTNEAVALIEDALRAGHGAGPSA